MLGIISLLLLVVFVILDFIFRLFLRPLLFIVCHSKFITYV